MATLRVLPLLVAPGAEQMARDEALLHSAAESGTPTLRFYRWETPTISLGYFQHSADRFHDEKLAELIWVRRSSGGAAIVHDPQHELTYSFAIPAAVGWPEARANAICEFHYLIRDSLKEYGANTRTVLCGEEKKLGDVLCFLHQTPGDLVLESSKVVGSAQRKLHGAFLQHGTILLSQSPSTPQLPGIRELTGVSVPVADFVADLTRRFARALGSPVAPGDWTPHEMQMAEQILREKYSLAEWNERR